MTVGTVTAGVGFARFTAWGDVMDKWEAEYETGHGEAAERRTLIIEARDEATARNVAEENTGVHETLVRFEVFS